MTDETTDPGRFTFINNGGHYLGERSTEDLDRIARHLVAELLEHADNPDHVLNLITSLSLIEDIPATLLFGSTIRILVTDVLGNLQASSPNLRMTLQTVAGLYRSNR